MRSRTSGKILARNSTTISAGKRICRPRVFLACTAILHSLTHSCICLYSYSKPDQVIYSGSVKQKEKVEEFYEEEIGPQVVQTIKVGT